MRKKFSNKLKTILIISLSFIVLSGVIIYAIDSWDTGWRIYAGTQKIITISTGTLYQITNNCAYGLFVPTRILTEWDSFVVSKPSCISYCQTINGGWSDWSSCTATENCAGRCGTIVTSGTQTRTCTAPSPQCGGTDCTGDSTQSCIYTYSCSCGEGEFCNSETGYCEPTEFTE